MKKALAIVFVFVFLVTQSGLAVSLHWCKGKIAALNFFTVPDYSTHCGEKAIKSDCCAITTLMIKVVNDFSKVNQNSFKFSLPKFPVSFPADMVLFSRCEFQKTTYRIFHPPPNNSSVPLYLKDRIFLI